MIEARCFGRSEIVTPEGRILPTSELVFAFALYMCVRAGEYVPRTELVEMFWPQSDEVKGRHSLRQMLYRLKELGFTLDEDGELLSVSPLRVRCDLADALRSDWIIEADEATIAAACDALPGLTRRFSERYGEWIDEVRARLEAQFRRAALRVLAEVQAEGRWYDVEHWALMLMRSDPLNETAVLARAEGTAMLGSKAEAIAQLDRYLDELGPNAEKIGLPAKLLRRRIKELGERKEGEQRLPLVGREDVVRRLTEAMYGRTSTATHGFFVYGPAGIGKTRLLSECAEIGAMNGMGHIAIRLSARDIDRPNSVLLYLLQNLLNQRGCIGADPRAIAIAKRAHKPHSPIDETPLTGTAVITPHDIEWATEQLLSATLEEGRLVVSVDNVQYTTVEDLAQLNRVLVRQNPERVMWYLAGREVPTRAPTHGAPSALSLATAVHLKPLKDEDALRLAQIIVTSSGQSLSEDVATLTVELAGGNPLFIEELARSLKTGHTGQRLTRTLQKTISERICTLTDEQLEICRIVYLLDTEATLAHVRSLCTSSSLAQTSGISCLESEGILKAGPSGTVTLHDCWRQAIFDEMSPLSRAMLAIRAAEYLATREGAQESTDLLASAARLFAIGDDRQRAFKHFLASARLLYESGLCSLALKQLEQAEQQSPSPKDTLDLLCVRACAEHALGKFQSASSTATQGLSLGIPSQNHSRGNETTLTAVLADANWKAGMPYADALAQLGQLVTSQAISSLAREHGCFLGLRLAYNSHASETAEHFLYWSNPDETKTPTTPFAALANLVHLAERGSTGEVISACSVMRQSDMSSIPVQYSLLAQRYISQSLRWAGDYPNSISVAEAAYTEASRIGLLDESAMLALQLAFTKLDMSDTEGALSWIERAESNSPSPRSHERTIALRHARSRYLIQRSDWREAYALLRPHLEDISGDQTLRRRLAETACLTLAAVKCSDSETARHAFSMCRKLFSADTPSLQTDFPATALYRALTEFNEDTEAKALLADYCERRLKSFNRPVAPYFSEIAERLSLLSISQQRAAP